jgi:hypothetical protein
MRRINPEAPLTPQQKYKRYYDKHRDEVLRSCDKCRRALLCGHCNVLIGMAAESIEILSNAIEYLKGYQK